MIRGIISITIIESEKGQDIKLLVEDGGKPLNIGDIFRAFAHAQKRFSDIIDNQKRIEILGEKIEDKPNG